MSASLDETADSSADLRAISPSLNSTSKFLFIIALSLDKKNVDPNIEMQK